MELGSSEFDLPWVVAARKDDTKVLEVTNEALKYLLTIGSINFFLSYKVEKGLVDLFGWCVV